MNDEQKRITQSLIAYFIQTLRGNAKLGSIYSFSLPAQLTCPGLTDYCLSRCYALDIQARYPNTRKAWMYNYAITRRKDFATILTAALSQLPSNIMRVHVSGDFHSAPYFNAWMSALNANPHIHPFAFTRSYRDSRVRKAFELAGYPSWLMASVDPMTGPPPPEMRKATMSDVKMHRYRGELLNKDELKAIPLICTEQVDKEVTCASCGRCPRVKRVHGELIQLKSTKGVSFAEH